MRSTFPNLTYLPLLSTRYLRMQCLAIAGGRSSYQLREFEAYEKTDKMLLEEALAKGEVFTDLQL